MSKFDIQLFANVIHGNSSKNRLTNTEDNTQIYGLAGNDTLESVNKKNAVLIGGSGNDILQITGGSGTLSGGAGTDTFYLNYSATSGLSAVIEDIDPDKEKIVITYGGNSVPNFNYSISGNNVIWTDEEGYFNVTLKGSSSSDDYYDEECNEYIWDVLWLVNQERERQGLNQLILAQGLIEAASVRAVEIEELYSHTRPNGNSCFTAVKKSYGGMGENIYTSPTTPEAAMEGWMNSTGHRENILRDYFKFIGIGYYHNEDSTSWKDHWVQMFGGSSYSTTAFTAKEILKTNITAKTETVPAEIKNDEIKISNGNTHIGTGGNYEIDNGFSGTIKITTNDAVTIDGTAASNLNNIRVLAYSETVNLSIISGDNDNNLIVERASLHNSDISSWQLPNHNKITIDGGKGNDSVSNKNINAVILGGTGKDSIYNEGDSVKIDGGADADYIISKSNSISMNGGAGNDTLRVEKTSTYNWDLSAWEDTAYSKATISGGAGDDYISNENADALILGGNDNDNVKNYSDFVKIEGETGNDIIINGEFFAKGGVKVSLSGCSGNDTISNSGSNSLIEGGAGDDFIHNGSYFFEDWNIYYDSSYNGEHDDSLKSSNVTIEGGTGNDIIYNRGENVIFKYKKGDGNDTVYGYLDSNEIQISGGSYTTNQSGNNLIIQMDSDSITLIDAKTKKLNIVTVGGGTEDTVPVETIPADTLPAGLSIKNSVLTAASSFKGTKIDLADYPAATKVNASALSKAVSIVGTAANNSLKGGKGADTISGGSGNDTVSLGGGNDVYIYSGGNDLIQDYTASDKIKLSKGSIKSASVSSSNVILKTSNGNITVKGGKSKEITIIDSKGKESVYGGTSADTLPAGLSIKNSIVTASNTFKGTKIDLVDYKTATKVNASALSKAVSIVGSSAANSLSGGSGKDTISGGAGKDSLFGNNGNDILYGGAGNDYIEGGKGNDSLYGDAGNDTLTGGAGKDVFIFSGGKDTITDYTSGDDKIKISSGTISKTTYSGSNVIFKIGSGSLTVKDGKGKKITIVDSSGKTSTKTYTSGVSARTLDLIEDTNFMTDDNNLDSITEQKSSVTQIQDYKTENLAQESTLLTFAKEK